MMKFSYNRDKTELLRIMKRKSAKKNLKITCVHDRIQVSPEAGKFSNGEDAVPVIFKGKITGGENETAGCTLKGKYSYGFYLHTLVIVAVILIAARFIWSAYQKQMENMILCGIVAVLLILVICIVLIKTKPAKKIINDFLNNLNVK